MKKSLTILLTILFLSNQAYSNMLGGQGDGGIDNLTMVRGTLN